MQEIFQEYNLTEAFNLELEIKMEGEVIIRERANSLVQPFLHLLYSGMGKKFWKDTSSRLWFHKWDPALDNFPETAWMRIVSTSPTTLVGGERSVTVAAAIGQTPVAGDAVQISGVRTPANLNGLWPVTSLADANRTIVLTGATPSVIGTSTYVDGSTPSRVIWYKKDVFASGAGVFDDATYKEPWICVGTSAQTTDRRDWGLYNLIIPGTSTGQLVHESMIYAVPAVGGETSTLTVTRDLTNNSGATITVNEVGLMAQGWVDASMGNDNSIHLLARDLSTFSIPNGSTIEISYRITTQATATGGFLRQFNELLYRHFSGLSREAKDIDNANQTKDETSDTFRVAIGGGSNYIQEDPSTLSKPQQYAGVQVGSSSSPVAFADFALASRIGHGNGAGQLFYYGTVVDLWIGNTTATQFDCIGMFENQSGATVAVKETSLYTHDAETTPSVNHALARHALAAAVNVPDGQCLKVTYRFSV